MRFIFPLVVFLFLTPTLSAQANSNDWQLAKDSKGIKVYTRSIEGSPLKEFRGVTHINTSITSLLALMDDADACVDWMHNCKNQTLLSRPNNKGKYTYNHIGAPWPVKDRDMVVYSYTEQDPNTYRVRVALKAVTGHKAKQKGIVRMTNMHGYWDFNPTPNGAVEVTYQMFTDPAGSIPSAIINSTVVDTPFNTLNNMRVKVQEEKYQTRVLKSIHNPS